MAFETGISSACFFPLDTIQSVAECKKGGFDLVEIFINTDSEMYPPYCDGLFSYVRENGMRVVSVHPYTSGYENVIFYTGYERRINDGIEFYKRYFDFAARIGAKFVVFHGNNMKTKFCGVEKYCEIFSRINEAAHGYGIELIHENQTWSIARNAEGVSKLRAACPGMKFVFDAKQACRGGYDPYAVLRAMGDHVVHVHINDWEDGSCRPPCMGKLDLKRIIDRLYEVGYTGDLMVEVYREDFTDVYQLKEAAEKLRKEIIKNNN
ncbi:MAG: sugar phosphate isomerase/epimerase [Clostridia bacterium]|nr:sugar phosphate isomerase/epimerase [Clostridia bacterium]